ncbi:hypothetical protein [Bdellovibrio sp. HCB274]|uniref:hypothetical protein n=1 Tax=Bdellovibrio sp. HCB274 TaxID=3394361 RepID=UPI0039B42A71
MFDSSSILLAAIGGAIGGGVGTLLAGKFKNPGVRSGLVAGLTVASIQLAPLTPLKGIIDTHIFKKTKFEVLSAKAAKEMLNDPIVRKKLDSYPQDQWQKVAFQASHDGMYLMDLEQLDRWNDFRLKLAAKSEKLCVSFLRGGMDMKVLASAFEGLTDEELEEWFKISMLAARRGIEAGKSYTDKAPQKDFMSHLPAVIAVNGPDEEGKLKAGLQNYMLSEDKQACWTLVRIHENSKKLSPAARHEFLRGMAAL